MALNFLMKDPREITFELNDKKISPEQVFKHLYAGLDHIISENYKKEFLGKRKKGHTEQWFPDQTTGITAEVEFDDTSRIKYSVEARTNFDFNYILKTPSIAYLRAKDSIVILREAKKHDEEMIKKVCFKRFQNSFDMEATKQFYQANDAPLEPKKYKGVIYLPEPNLTQALEQIYMEQDINRVTPKHAYVDSSEDKLWYLREFLTIAKDTSFKAETFAKYFSVLHSLGLMEILDRQTIHYSLIDNEVGNYDPDFFTYSKSKKKVIETDWNDIKNTFLSEQFPIPNEPKVYFKCMKSIMNKQMDELAKKGIDDDTILKYIHTSITPNGPYNLELNK